MKLKSVLDTKWMEIRLVTSQHVLQKSSVALQFTRLTPVSLPWPMKIGLTWPNAAEKMAPATMLCQVK